MRARSIGWWMGMVLVGVGSYCPIATASTFEFDLREYSSNILACSPTLTAADSGSSPVGDSVSVGKSNSVGWDSSTLTAVAERGAVRARVATTVHVNPPFNNYLAGGCAFAEFTLDDLVLSGPAGSGVAAMHFEVAGIVTGDDPRDAPPVSISVTFASHFPAGATRSSTTLSVPGGSGSFTTSPIAFVSGDSFSIRISILVKNGLGVSLPGDTNANDLDYASPAGFFGVRLNIGGPVLSLPAGYTVDSVDGHIVDNVYLGAELPKPAPALGPAGVASLILVLGGMVALSLAMRERARST